MKVPANFFNIQITPDALAITARNERGVLMTLRLDPASRLIFEREDLPEAYVVFIFESESLVATTMTGMETGNLLNARDRLSRLERNWIVNGRLAMLMLRPPIARWQFN
ncbi:MAG: hypothetical protein WCE68_17415 [Anaerolineales bacterium]